MARGNVMCNGNAIFLSRGNSLSKEGEEEGGIRSREWTRRIPLLSADSLQPNIDNKA